VRASAKHGAAYAFDAEDFHLGDLPDTPEHALNRCLIRDIESRCIPGASYITAASPMIADAYVEAYGIDRPTVVLNVFPRGHAPSAPSARGTVRPGPSLYWFSQTIGPGRGLETAVEAIAHAATAPHLYLRGTPASGYADALSTLAQEYGVGDRLHFLAPEAPDEMERLGAQYDLGFSGEAGFSRNNATALGNKLFSYLLGGVPIVASDVPAHRAIAPEIGEAMTLFRIGDAVALAATIDQHLGDPARLAAVRAHAWRLAQQRYCWEVEQRVFLDAVEGALARQRLSVA
jgi:glycosyltransferase involved in cell wall biosynthesis